MRVACLFPAVLVVIFFPSSIHSSPRCSFSSDRVDKPRRPAARTEVNSPGVRSRPSTGQMLTVFQLNNATLLGHFISHSSLGVYFKSTCDGHVHVWRAGGANILEHKRVSQQRELYFVKIERHPFVYETGRTGRIYKLPEYQSTQRKEVEREFIKRSTPDPSDDEAEMRQAFEGLAANPDSRLLANLSQALGELGIYGHKSPCALPLYAMAMSVSRHLPPNKEENVIRKRQLPCTRQQLGEKSSHRRNRRGWFWGQEADAKDPEDSCSLENDPNDDNCLGMCGYGCQCWDWDFVCEDCCYHQGCYEHDLCCRRGFLTADCLWPTNFKCDRYSSYPACLYDQ